ncbi:MAG: hypothetical protein JSU92_06115 [Deltaproteobacteria bacterium]|nr:MAG: hypothetical protein JSU92_06115 [Deltaproteobacteria bacterium]
MANKYRFFKSGSLIEKPLMDEFFKPPCTVSPTQSELLSGLSFGGETASSFLEEDEPSASIEDLLEHSVPPGLRKNAIIAIGLGKKRTFLKILLISGGAVALLLLVLRMGSYLFVNPSLAKQSSAKVVSKGNPLLGKAIVPPSDPSEDFLESALFTAPPPRRPSLKGKKISEVRSAAEKVNVPSPVKAKRASKVAAKKKVEKSAEQSYQLYVDKKFILGEARAVSLKLSLLGVENKIVKRKDGGYTIFTGAFKELNRAREARKKVLNTGYQADIYSVVKN